MSERKSKPTVTLKEPFDAVELERMVRLKDKGKAEEIHREIRKEVAYERATRVKNEHEKMREDGRRDTRLDLLEDRVYAIEEFMAKLKQEARGLDELLANFRQKKQ